MIRGNIILKSLSIYIICGINLKSTKDIRKNSANWILFFPLNIMISYIFVFFRFDTLCNKNKTIIVYFHDTETYIAKPVILDNKLLYIQNVELF